ncbi:MULTISPECIES: hypothetical protein [unclassified Aureimonas]|uniref:hypothetical protein n=1 Tax=unclassified Aureimonas TaxID=2615206 RepID=UPI0006F86E2D|nr:MULTISPECIES: hypothetical protein [unclassified Aureimonas]KQT60481.1 hypothetical protein ASG62_07480 [Aureimonas sp. Leaf427]KQT79358.1 hypothetical protein ASG54_10080 [Aureimonas sp. Leaf460]
MKLRSACLASLLVLGAVLPAAAQADLACEAAAPADALLSSFGMNTHMQQGWQYSDARKTVAVLKDLGITQVREAFVGLGHEGLEYAAQQGIRFLYFIPGGDIGEQLAGLEAWEKRYPGSILAIEGPNEVNNWPIAHRGLTGIPAAQAFQKELYEGVHASEVLRSIPVLALTSWPVFINHSDIGNVHAYSRDGGFMSSRIVAAILDEQTLNPPAKTIWMTEAGYHTHLGEDYDEGVSEALQAKMATTMFLSAFARGLPKTFYYQLANQYTDPNDQQAYFGLVDQSWAPKPAFTALKSMIAIVRDAAGSQAATAASLRYALDGLPETAQHKAFRTSAGEWLIAVWNEPEDIWDRAGNIELPVPSADVTLRLGEPASDMALYDPLVGTSAVRTVRDAPQLSFPLSSSPLFIRIKPMPRATPASDC